MSACTNGRDGMVGILVIAKHMYKLKTPTFYKRTEWSCTYINLSSLLLNSMASKFEANQLLPFFVHPRWHLWLRSLSGHMDACDLGIPQCQWMMFSLLLRATPLLNHWCRSRFMCVCVCVAYVMFMKTSWFLCFFQLLTDITSWLVVMYSFKSISLVNMGKRYKGLRKPQRSVCRVFVGWRHVVIQCMLWLLNITSWKVQKGKKV